jgi:hypothetical protein
MRFLTSFGTSSLTSFGTSSLASLGINSSRAIVRQGYYFYCRADRHTLFDNHMPRIAVAAIGVAISLAGCTGEKPANNRDTMTQRQKDSVFGQSGVPGAAAIPKAQRAADSLNAARKRQDSAMIKPDTTSD